MVRRFKVIFTYLLLLFGIVITLFPFIYMILTSFVQEAYILPRPNQIFSVVPNFDNYIEAWTSNNFFRYFLNSLLVASVTTVFQLLFGSMTAYSFARFQFPFKEGIFKIFLLTLMIPGVLNIVPQFTIIRNFGLVDTYSGLWLLYIGGGMVGITFFLRGFFSTIPKEMEESVVIDGGGNWRIFFNIYLPMSLPALGTQAIFSFSGAWDEFFTALTILKTESKRTIPIALQLFQGQHASDWGLVFAASIIAIIPIITIYIIFQKRFVQGGQNEGAVKG